MVYRILESFTTCLSSFSVNKMSEAWRCSSVTILPRCPPKASWAQRQDLWKWQSCWGATADLLGSRAWPEEVSLAAAWKCLSPFLAPSLTYCFLATTTVARAFLFTLLLSQGQPAMKWNPSTCGYLLQCGGFRMVRHLTCWLAPTRVLWVSRPKTLEFYCQ